jgi:hypothetical protein
MRVLEVFGNSNVARLIVLIVVAFVRRALVFAAGYSTLDNRRSLGTTRSQWWRRWRNSQRLGLGL